MPRINIARVYKTLKQKMKFLWGGDLKLNTVHVEDVCRALWHLTDHGKLQSVYNLVDKNDTDQRKLNLLLENLFQIKTGFVNSVYCKFAKLNLKSTTEAVNDKHLGPWSTLCREYKIESTPLSPFLAPEILYDYSLYADGSMIESTGFIYSHPNVTLDQIKIQLDYWILQKVFPPLNEKENLIISKSESSESDSNPNLDEIDQN